jgi:predicted hydrolase (HD superfamily)
MLTRGQALELVNDHVSKKNIVYQVIAVEAIMRELATHVAEDDEKWGLTGLLHDVDYERTEATPERHSLLAENMLKESASGDVKGGQGS